MFYSIMANKRIKPKLTTEAIVWDIKCKTLRKFTSKEKIRVVNECFADNGVKEKPIPQATLGQLFLLYLKRFK